MSLDGVTGSGNAAALRGADISARAGGVLSTLEARQRYSPLDGFQIAGQPGSQRSKTPADPQPDDAANPQQAARGKSDDGQASSRIVTAFVVQSLAQEQEAASIGAAAPAASRITAGLRAYARSSGTGAGAGQGEPGVEVIPPRLSSGHALDLAV